jgi:hypothetical protein
MEDLERDWPVVLEVSGEEDRRHAAATELMLEAVTISKASLKTGWEVRQGRRQRRVF